MFRIYNYFLWLRAWSIHHNCLFFLVAPMGKELTSATAKVLEIVAAAYVLIGSHYIYSLLIFLECDI